MGAIVSGLLFTTKIPTMTCGAAKVREESNVDHKVIKTEVVPVKRKYGVRFEFDDGYTDFAEVGDKATAEFYAAVQLGERIPMNVNPLLLNAAKAETLRRKGTK
jgi:hypothetical protein